MEIINPDKNIILEKKLFVFDMDGTIYLGDRVFAGAIRFIDHLRASGRRILFFTNNASRSPRSYLDKLTRMGFSPSGGEIMTSGDVTVEFLKSYRADKSVYLVGTKDLTESFFEAGINLVSDTQPDIVVTSFDTELTYEKLKNACRYIRNGAEYLSTHPDFNCPTENGFIPDSGAIAALVTASTGKEPTYFGKPYPQTVEMICHAMNITKQDMCVFGDRLYTDIAVGKKNGVTSVLVMTGETTEEMLEAAPADQTPDFVFDSLDALDKLLFGGN